MKIYGPYIIYILFICLNFIFSVEYLKKYGSVEINCEKNNFLIFDSSSFPIPSTIHFKFSIKSNSYFDKVISFEYDFIDINDEPKDTNNERTELNNSLTEVDNKPTDFKYNMSTENENNSENSSVIFIENTIKISNKSNNENNIENNSEIFIEQIPKFRYVIYPSSETEENINNIKYNLSYFNIDKNQARVGDKFGNNLLISFNCKGILNIENTENDLSSGLSIVVLIIIIVGGALVIIIIVIVLVCYIKKNMGKKDDKKLINNKILKKIQNENKETGQVTNKERYKYRNSINLKRRFKRLSIQSSSNSSALRVKKRTKKS